MSFNLSKFIRASFPESEVLFTSSGRSALQAAIEDFHLQNSQIIVSSFICSDVFSSLFTQNKIKPILIDCPKNSFNITLRDIKSAYNQNKKAKAVLIVHTFGEFNPDTEKIARFCREKKLILIEDCAHCLGLKVHNKVVGSFGDASIFSFYKTANVFSGGAYIRNNGKISIRAKPYRINNLDIYRFFQLAPLGKAALRLVKRNKAAKISIDPEKIEIISAPKIFSLFRVNDNQINIEKRRESAELLHSLLAKKIKLPKLNKNNFFHSIPILVKNQARAFDGLVNSGIEVRKFWTETLSQNKNYKQKTPNAERFSREILNILVDPRWTKNQIKNKAEKILSVLASCSTN